LYFAKLSQDLQRRFRFVLVNQAHAEADMDQRPVANAPFEWMVFVNHTLQADFSLDTANVDERHLLFSVGDFYDLAGNSKTHWFFLIG
jgi:hypothetical protein